MKRQLQRVAALFTNEIQVASFAISTMRISVRKIGLLTLLLIAGKSITEAHMALPFLRGGSTAVAATRSATRHMEKHRRTPNPILFKLANLQQVISVIGEKIQTDAGKQWSAVGSSVSREWGKLSSSVVRLFPSKKKNSGSKKLDDVLRSFSSVLNGKDVDTAQLLKACRAHLILMKSGGSALRLVAKDLESNLQKAEALFKKIPKKGKYLTSLLETERESGLHDGNMLQDPSAAVGLLWIRRSLSFQSDLYASLIPPEGQHPRDAAMDAYSEHLSPYHGWMLQKVFPLSLSQMPERGVFISKFGGVEFDELEAEYEREIVKKLRSLVATWEPILDLWRDEFVRLDLEDIRRV